jgi:hypothetical protein
MPPVVVEEQRASLLPPYAGGQVARGGQLGILGNRDIMDTPFNQTNFTAELMENQQVRHVADVLRNDPTAHANASTSTGADDFNIRGFYVGNTDLLFNAAFGFDYRIERLRLSADLGYQKQNLQGITDFTSIVAGISVPKAPNNNGNYDGPDDFSKPEVFYGTLRGEFDLNAHLTAFAAFGGSLRRTRYNLTNRTIIDAQGNLAAGSDSLAADKMPVWTLETGLQGRFATGPVKHRMVLAYSLLDREWRRINGPPFPFPASNRVVP